MLIQLIKELRSVYGSDFKLIFPATEDNGIYFRLDSTPAMFSVLQEAPDIWSVQVTSSGKIPPELGYDMYLYDSTCNTRELINLIDLYQKEMCEWPI